MVLRWLKIQINLLKASLKNLVNIFNIYDEFFLVYYHILHLSTVQSSSGEGTNIYIHLSFVLLEVATAYQQRSCM